MHKIQPKTFFVGKNMVYLPTCHSTNDIASEKIQNAAAIDGTIVITDHQTSGRGQRGNSWEAAPGENITMSLILEPRFLHPSEQFNLNIAVSNGICDFFRNRGIEKVSVKWPNDIYINDRKIGGVLIESTISGSQISYSVIGIGLNINQSAFDSERATSLVLESESLFYPLEGLVEELCLHLETAYLELKEGRAETHRMRYLNNLYRYGVPSRFRDSSGEFPGRITGVDAYGRLLVEGGSSETGYDIKEITYLFD